MATPVIEREEKLASVVHRWPPQGEWTYDDYARLPDDGRRYEVIGGNLYVSPAPQEEHQRVSMGLASELHQFVRERKLGRVYPAPFDVILPDKATPVQPDIIFISNENLNIVTSKRIKGIPDLIVEILSPSSIGYDQRVKYDLYAETGVKEYWIVDPINCTVEVFTRRGNVYVPFGQFGRDGIIQSELLPELRIPLADICAA